MRRIAVISRCSATAVFTLCGCSCRSRRCERTNQCRSCLGTGISPKSTTSAYIYCFLRVRDRPAETACHTTLRTSTASSTTHTSRRTRTSCTPIRASSESTRRCSCQASRSSTLAGSTPYAGNGRTASPRTWSSSTIQHRRDRKALIAFGRPFKAS
jgi:hypothetical protein